MSYMISRKGNSMAEEFKASIHDRLEQAMEALGELERRRVQAGDAQLGRHIEEIIIQRELDDLERESLP